MRAWRSARDLMDNLLGSESKGRVCTSTRWHPVPDRWQCGATSSSSRWSTPASASRAGSSRAWSSACTRRSMPSCSPPRTRCCGLIRRTWRLGPARCTRSCSWTELVSDCPEARAHRVLPNGLQRHAGLSNCFAAMNSAQWMSLQGRSTPVRSHLPHRCLALCLSRPRCGAKS